MTSPYLKHTYCAYLTKSFMSAVYIHHICSKLHISAPNRKVHLKSKFYSFLPIESQIMEPKHGPAFKNEIYIYVNMDLYLRMEYT